MIILIVVNFSDVRIVLWLLKKEELYCLNEARISQGFYGGAGDGYVGVQDTNLHLCTVKIFYYKKFKI